MRRMLLVGAAIALAGSTVAAQAQNATPSQTTIEASPAQTAPTQTRGMMSSGMGRGEMPMMKGGDMMERGGMPMMRGGDMMERGGMPMMRGSEMFRTSAAVLHFRMGDLSMTVKCADNESTQTCANAASALLEKIRQNAPPQSHP
ncbi:MAG: hypothetical protein ACREF3_11695 [Acetobacteraceae bacterium]